MTNTDAGYSGPEFDFDKIIKDLMNKVGDLLCLYGGRLYSVSHSDPKAADRQRLIESL